MAKTVFHQGGETPSSAERATLEIREERYVAFEKRVRKKQNQEMTDMVD